MRLPIAIAASLLVVPCLACDKSGSTTPPPETTPAADDSVAATDREPVSEPELPEGKAAAGLDAPDVDHEKEGKKVTADTGTTDWFVQAFEAFSVGDIDPIVSNFGLEITWEAVGSPIAPPSQGKQAVLDRWEGLLTGIPDMKLTPQRIFKQDKLVVVQVVLTGTHLGDFRGLPPTNKKVGTEVLAWIWHDEDNTAKKVRVVYNEGALLAQMGVVQGEVPPIPEIPQDAPEVVEAEANAANEKLAKKWVKTWGNNAWKTCLKKKVCDKELVTHDTASGRDTAKPEDHEAAAKAFGTAVPDLEAKAVDVVSIGDWLLVHAKLTGTHKGKLGDLEPTNKKLDLDTSTVAKVESGKVVETWRYSNYLQMLDQLGLFDKPGA